MIADAGHELWTLEQPGRPVLVKQRVELFPRILRRRTGDERGQSYRERHDATNDLSQHHVQATAHLNRQVPSFRPVRLTGCDGTTTAIDATDCVPG